MLDLIGLVASIIEIVMLVFSIYIGMSNRNRQSLQRSKDEEETKRQSQPIRVKLRNGAQEIELPMEFRRSEFSRDELQGRLGNIRLTEEASNNQKGRFQLRYLNTKDYFMQINRVVDAQGNADFIIPCNDAELRQFDKLPENVP